MKLVRRNIMLVGLCCSTMLSGRAAYAQNTGEPPAADRAVAGKDDPTNTNEIIVTAQRRQERSRDVPITITTLDAGRLASAGANQLADIARLTPGIRFDTVTNFVQPTVRGIGTAVSVSGGGSNVGIYIDGFYNPNPLASNLDLANVSNVQILKGPQGTLFGRNTTGGAILVTTAEPSVKPGGKVEVSYGRFNEQRYRAYATTGLTDRIAVDLEGQYRKGDGFQTNIVDGNGKIGKFENWYVRAGVKADVSDNVSILLRYNHSNTDDPIGNLFNTYVAPNGDVLAITPLLTSGLVATRPNDVSVDGRHGFTARADVVQGTVKIDLGIADMVSYTQYRRDKSSSFNNFDATAAPIFTGHLLTDAKTISQELLFTSKPGGPLQWTAGLFYFRNDERWDFGIGTTVPDIPLLANHTTTNTYAAYADLTYEVSPQFFITAGARYSHDTVTDAWFTSVAPATFGQRFDIPDYKTDHLTPRVVLRYKPSDTSSLYASFTKGYKAGLLNVGGEQFAPVRPESITAYEVGYKFDNRTLSFDLSGFYYDYKDLQVSTYFSNTALIANAAKSRIYGLDAQVRYRTSIGLELNAGGAYTNAKYRRFDGSSTEVRCGPAEACAGLFRVQPVNVVNGQMQRAPEFTANAGASYPIEFAGGSRLTLSGNLYYTSSFFFDSSEQFRENGYEVLALRAEWTDASRRFTIAAYADNVTNNRYRTQVFTADFGVANTWSAPTTYGVSVSMKL